MDVRTYTCLQARLSDINLPFTHDVLAEHQSLVVQGARWKNVPTQDSCASPRKGIGQGSDELCGVNNVPTYH